ncbi:MAG TPA: NUDIX domain-containing protein [Hypericibacter adhaerens]|uniref:NUDIX domain-containing protein n=1 Tax=Hypericibacter adhaerens TaxID=2602016 RepID=A0A5J6N589_9PROT|nr:NUDIX domain-containing protein [Hypericibacter adhaerens]QEX23893.1 NUDIX domain-containing protein [Hypericibacter adhaerens]HWA43079.1 NUDIX domain-containing protein [Hypericibacter adhaerens]
MAADKPSRPSVVVDLHLVLMKSDQVLLGLRQGTGYCDGMYHLPAGHLEAGETVMEGTIREAREELGVGLRAADLRLDYVLHHRSNSDRMALFFSASRWSGEPTNREPDKCEALAWFPLDRLPPNMVPYAAHALSGIRNGERLGFYGWPPRESAAG